MKKGDICPKCGKGKLSYYLDRFLFRCSNCKKAFPNEEDPDYAKISTPEEARVRADEIIEVRKKIDPTFYDEPIDGYPRDIALAVIKGLEESGQSSVTCQDAYNRIYEVPTSEFIEHLKNSIRD